VSLTASFACDRCLSPFRSPLISSYRMYYVPEERADLQVDPSELQVVPPGFSTIDMTEDVRQTIVLSIPPKLLCSESCKGLCPNCGVNLNSDTCSCRDEFEDTRWEQLSKLKNQGSTS
jgi:uncharacterized protein